MDIGNPKPSLNPKPLTLIRSAHAPPPPPPPLSHPSLPGLDSQAPPYPSCKEMHISRSSGARDSAANAFNVEAKVPVIWKVKFA